MGSGSWLTYFDQEGIHLKANEYKFNLRQDNLHRHLAGALPKGMLMLIEGGHGSGKSALSQRLLFGLVSNGHKVTYISTEMTTKGFIDQMNSLDYPILDYLMKGELMFIPVFPLVGKPLPRHDFLDRLISSPQLFQRDITIIDTLSALVRENIDEDSAVDLLGFFKKLAGKSKNIIICVDPSDLNDTILDNFRGVSDIYLELQTKYEEEGLSKKIIVKRFGTATDNVGNIIGFRIEPGTGLIVDITMIS